MMWVIDDVGPLCHGWTMQGGAANRELKKKKKRTHLLPRGVQQRGEFSKGPQAERGGKGERERQTQMPKKENCGEG